VVTASRDVGASTEIHGRVALSILVVSPATDDPISERALLDRNNRRRREKRNNKPISGERVSGFTQDGLHRGSALM
jgi:hypothetical protein